MQETLATFNQIVNELLTQEKLNPVANYIPSDELFNKIDLNLNDEPIDFDEFKTILLKLTLSTPRTATNAFFNQLFGGRNEKAILGELLTVVLNNSMYTYKAAGPQIGVEQVIIKKMCELVGWNDKAGGTLAPGGSMTNFMAMLMARDANNHEVTQTGVQKTLTVYTSNQSHYSIPKNAAFSGIGRKNVRFIDTNNRGEIDIQHLEETIINDVKNGLTPVLVNLTAGTTVLGAFDPIDSVSEICKKYNIWLHVDGAYCGSVMFSEKYKHLIGGIEKVDSFSVNAHKMLGVPLSCSIILAKDKGQLYRSFSNDASYLYQTDHDEFNPGKISLQCGRRNDALKFWTLWKQIGSKGLEQLVDKQFKLGDVARNYIKNNENYTMYSYDNSISVCFNYKDITAREICNLMYEKSELMVGYGSFKGDEFIRLVTINAQNEEQDIINFFKKLEEFAERHF